MKYSGSVNRQDAELALEREGLRLGSRFLDFADVAALRPVDHRVFIDTLAGETIEIGMLGFSYDGFWEELCGLYGDRSLEALFVEEKLVMRCEGEYVLPGESGRADIALYEDAVCILPPSCRAVRIPLCFADRIREDGYLMTITLASGAGYTVGRMGYDTKPFFERTARAADRVKKERARALEKIALTAPFTVKGLFRTAEPEKYWQAALGPGVCAVELFAGEDAATYLYRFAESEPVFLRRLEEAMEAMGPHREVIFRPQEQIDGKPLWRMALRRSEALAFLRARSAGRLIHTEGHAERLRAFLNGE